jgi:hypothetical protein
LRKRALANVFKTNSATPVAGEPIGGEYILDVGRNPSSHGAASNASRKSRPLSPD